MILVGAKPIDFKKTFVIGQKAGRRSFRWTSFVLKKLTQLEMLGQLFLTYFSLITAAGVLR
jgi:hypothetical protein